MTTQTQTPRPTTDDALSVMLDMADQTRNVFQDLMRSVENMDENMPDVDVSREVNDATDAFHLAHRDVCHAATVSSAAKGLSDMALNMARVEVVARFLIQN